jgi:hypothetical protein
VTWLKDPGVPGYAMVKPLGVNGAQVYLALQLATGAQVVVKLWSRGASDGQRREAAAVRLRHPNIVAVLEAGETQNGPFSVLEWLPNALSVAAKLRQGEARAIDAIRILEAIARALDHARAQGMCLGRLRPGDVMLTEGDVPKVLPVFVEDGSPSTSLAGDMHRIGVLIGAMVEGQPSAGSWNALRTIGARCLGGSAEPPVASLTLLMMLLGEIGTSAAQEPPSGPTRD